MAALRFYHTFRTILLLGRRSGLHLPWQSKESFPRFVKFYDLFCVFYFSYKIVCTLYAVSDNDELEVRFYLIGASLYFFYGLFPCLFFFATGERCGQSIHFSNGINKRILEGKLGDYDYFRKEYESSGSLLTRFARFMSVITFLCASLYCSSVPLIDFMHGRFRQRVAVPSQCPFEKRVSNVPGVFETIVLEQIAAFLVPGFQKFVTDCIMLALYRISGAYFSYLSLALSNVRREMAGSRRVTGKFIVWLKLHQDAVVMFHNLASLFSPVVVMYSLSSIALVTCCLFYQLEAKSANILQAIFGGGYMSLAMVQLYMLCHVADQVTSLAEKVAFEVYSLPWYEMDVESRKIFTLSITLANKPVYMEGYRTPSFRICRESFLALLANTVSAYVGLRKIRELHQL